MLFWCNWSKKDHDRKVCFRWMSRVIKGWCVWMRKRGVKQRLSFSSYRTPAPHRYSEGRLRLDSELPKQVWCPMISFNIRRRRKKTPRVETAGAPSLLHYVKRKCKMDRLSTIMFSSSSCYCYFSESTKKNYLELLVFTSLCTWWIRDYHFTSCI